MWFICKNAWLVIAIIALTNCSPSKTSPSVGGQAHASRSYVDTQIQILSSSGSIIAQIDPQEPAAAVGAVEVSDEDRLNKAWAQTGLTSDILFKQLMPTPLCLLSYREYLGCFEAARLLSAKIYGKETTLGVNGLGSDDMVGEPLQVMNDFTVYSRVKPDLKIKDKAKLSELIKKLADIENKNTDKVKELYEKSIVGDPIVLSSRKMFSQSLPNFFSLKNRASTLEEVPKLDIKQILAELEDLVNASNVKVTSDFARIFSEAFKVIEPAADAKWSSDVYNAFMSMASDGHAALHLTDEAKRALAASSSKENFFGIGVTIALINDHIYFSPIPGGPAAMAGIEANDTLISANGVLVKNDEEGLTAIVKVIKGEINTPVRIDVKKWGKDEIVTYNLIRQPIQTRSVEYRTQISGGHIYGVLQVKQFTSDVYELASAIVKKHDNKIEGWILDLRNDPGGYLDQAVALCSVFVRQGSKVVGRSLAENQDILDVQTLMPTRTPQLTTKRLVVLINAGSASASEIVSGFLQEAQRALVIGETSFGKGSMQGPSSEHYNIKNFNIWANAPFGDPTSPELLALGYSKVSNPKILFMRTSSRYFYPSGRTPEWSGVEPDIKATYAPGAESIFMQREKDYNPYGFASAGAPWMQPRQDYVNKVKSCVDSQGENSKGWDQEKALPFDDYQMMYASDALVCI